MENNKSKFTVIGLGQSGCNALEIMQKSMPLVNFIVIDTDYETLLQSNVATKIQLNNNGNSTDNDKELGYKLAIEVAPQLREVLVGTDMLFIVTGIGGGLGGGVAPVLAQIASSEDILTMAIITMPLDFEGPRKYALAVASLMEIKKYVDTLFLIPTKAIAEIYGKLTVDKSYIAANSLAFDAVYGVTDTVLNDGLINIDFADLKTILQDMKAASVCTVFAEGDNRALAAAKAIMKSPMLDEFDFLTIKGIIINVVAGSDFSLDELEVACNYVKDHLSQTAITVIGCAMADVDKMKVTAIFAGMELKPKYEILFSYQEILVLKSDTRYFIYHDSGIKEKAFRLDEIDEDSAKIAILGIDPLFDVLYEMQQNLIRNNIDPYVSNIVEKNLKE